MMIHQFRGGVELNKNGYLMPLVVKLPLEKIPLDIQQSQLPKRVVLSLGQCVDGCVKPIVAIGDCVRTGQILTEFDEFSTPVHSSISGRVIAIGNDIVNQKTKLKELAITIESDGKDEWIKTQGCGNNFKDCSTQTMIEYIHRCGIVGLGGAGFPTHVKLNLLKQCQTLIINGVECETGVSCDQAIIQSKPQAIKTGIEILRHITGASRVIIALEEQNHQSLLSLKSVISEGIEFALMPNKYTSGDEKVIIHSVLGVSVPSGEHGVDIGILCQNISTVYAIYKSVVKQQPLVSRVITLTGSALSHTQNYEVRLGSVFSEMSEISQALPVVDNLDYVIGGLVMGHHLSSLDYGLKKTTNSLFINHRFEVEAEQPCIRCGACHQVCPIGLLPQQLLWYAKLDETNKAMDYHILDCTTCASCSLVCPSHIPLHKYFARTQALYKNQQKEKQQSDIARERFEFRHLRLERNKIEKKAEMAKKKAQIQAKLAKDKTQKDKIQAALERTRAKK